MTKNNKEMKSRAQKGRDAHSKVPSVKPGTSKPTHSKYGTMRSQSEPVEPWDKTTERAAITRRNRDMKISLPKMPWDK